MKILRNLFISILLILLLCNCSQHRSEKEFLDKYEYEDFSQFKGTGIYIRDLDSLGNPMILVYAPHLIYDTSKVGAYGIIINKKNYKVIDSKWTLTENYVDADTVKLQHLAQTFMKYDVPHLKVDTVGNVFIYLKDVETLALVRFANDNEMLKRSKEYTWKKIKNRDNWYKPKR
jgi:hypothetical protein